MWVYVDQRLDSTGSAYKTGEYIGRIGTFVIGQVQTSVGRSRRKRLDSFAYVYNEVKIAFSLVPRLSSRYPDKTADVTSDITVISYPDPTPSSWPWEIWSRD